jgi:hypothetical protein
MKGPLPAPLRIVLDSIHRISRVTVDFDDKYEWIHLKSTFLSETALFQTLTLHWRHIVSIPGEANFALIYCRGDRNAGVWLHYLSSPDLLDDYEDGCHEIWLWSDK